MKTFLLLVFIASSVARADWPDASGSPAPQIKKALPVSDADRVTLQQTERIQEKEKELMKMSPSLSVWLSGHRDLFAKSPALLEGFLDSALKVEKPMEKQSAAADIPVKLDGAQIYDAMAPVREMEYQERMVNAAEKSAQSAEEANTIAKQNAALQESHARDAEMSYLLVAPKTQPATDTLPHSGTIFYDNGHTATYEGN